MDNLWVCCDGCEYLFRVAHLLDYETTYSCKKETDIRGPLIDVNPDGSVWGMLCPKKFPERYETDKETEE